MSKHVKVIHHTGEVSAMHELPRDLVTILRTEARNQRTPPIDYVIAEDGGRMVHRPEPDIAMAELLEEAAAALTARDAELAAVRANRTDAHGWLFNNPDTGIEWLDQHPIESGEVPDAENVRPASAEEVVTLLREAWNALAAERAASEKAEAALAEARKALEEAKRCLAENGYSYDHPESPLYVVCTALALARGERA